MLFDAHLLFIAAYRACARVRRVVVFLRNNGNFPIFPGRDTSCFRRNVSEIGMRLVEYYTCLETMDTRCPAREYENEEQRDTRPVRLSVCHRPVETGMRERERDACF